MRYKMTKWYSGAVTCLGVPLTVLFPRAMQIMAGSSNIEILHWGPPWSEPVPDWLKKAIYADPGSPNSVFRWGDDIDVYLADGAKATLRPGEYLIYGNGNLGVCGAEVFRNLFEDKSFFEKE